VETLGGNGGGDRLLLKVAWRVRFWPITDVGCCTAHVRFERTSKRNLFSADCQELTRHIATYKSRLTPVFVRCINALVMNADLMRADL